MGKRKATKKASTKKKDSAKKRKSKSDAATTPTLKIAPSKNVQKLEHANFSVLLLC
jgi:hypothetical protein